MKSTKSPTLGQLILQRKGDRSFETLAKDCGGEPAGRRLQQMTTRPIKNYPDPGTIVSLSRGLRTSAQEIVAAASRSLGIPVDGPSSDDLVIPGAGRLSAESVDRLVGGAAHLMKLEGVDG